MAAKSKTKPRGVLGALSNQVDDLRGEIDAFGSQLADMVIQLAANDALKGEVDNLKEMAGAAFGSVGTPAITFSQPVTFDEFTSRALIALVNADGYSAIGRHSVGNSLGGIKDLYSAYLMLCGSTNDIIDASEARFDHAIAISEDRLIRHTSEEAKRTGAGFGGQGAITREAFEKRQEVDTSNRNAMEEQLSPASAADPNFWRPDEADAVLGTE